MHVLIMKQKLTKNTNMVQIYIVHVIHAHFADFFYFFQQRKHCAGSSTTVQPHHIRPRLLQTLTGLRKRQTVFGFIFYVWCNCHHCRHCNVSLTNAFYFRKTVYRFNTLTSFHNCFVSCITGCSKYLCISSSWSYTVYPVIFAVF